MRKILSFVGAAIYTSIVYCLLHFCILFLIAKVMTVTNWWYLFLVAALFGVAQMVLNGLFALTIIPFAKFVKICNIARYIPVLYGLGYEIYALIVIWSFGFEYGALQWILGIITTLFVSIIYGTMTVSWVTITND